MWLLNTATLQLEFFQDDRQLEYAILSHRWEDDEVSFQDVQKQNFSGKGAGWMKLQQTCQKARQIGNYKYVWMDTCCIDKSSSAELSEAINSMYRWYQRSRVCIVYMYDVGGPFGGRFTASEWFRRGWTLQELLAPQRMEFYDSEWNFIGSRHDLEDEITFITRIPPAVLTGITTVDEYSIAQRMSWAARRVTTRVEDIAYSLLGLFDVNMPMLYGEGEKAFLRLQEAIMVDSPDDSIFAWHLQPDQYYHGLLARSPADFVDCSDVEMAAQPRAGYRKTSLGINFSATVHHYDMNVYHVALGCMQLLPSGESETIGIFVGFPLDHRPGDGVVGRRVVHSPSPHAQASFPPTNGSNDSKFVRTFNVPTRPFLRQPIEPRFNGIFVQKFKLSYEGIDITPYVQIVVRPESWVYDIPAAIQLPLGANGCVVGFAIRDAATGGKARASNIEIRPKWVIAKLGFNYDWGPAAWVADMNKIPAPEEVIKASPRVLTQGLLRDISEITKATSELSVYESLNDAMTSMEKDRYTGSRVDGMNIQEDGVKIRMWREMRSDLGGWTWMADLEISVANFAMSVQWPSQGAISAASMSRRNERILAIR